MSAPAQDGSLSPGTRVDAWIVGASLGAGAMGAVYEATDATLGRRVALKVLRRVFADDADAVARFEREARAASRIHHPGIVDVIAIGTLPDGRPYLVMSLLEGRSLRAELAARGPMPLTEAWALARQIALALAAAHDAGVVHRDVKPDNVFLERADDAPPRTRVVDFGLARLLPMPERPVDPKLTRTGVPMGTPPYMAPEQWWGKDVGPAADQYSLMAVFLELVTGRPPFPGTTVVELVQQHLHEPPPRLADRGVTAPEALEAALARALAKDPSERFATMRDLVAAVDVAMDPRIAAAAPTTASPSTRGPVVRTVAALLACLAGLVAAGYSGPARWDVLEWFRIAGWAAPMSALLALVAAIVILRSGHRLTTGAVTLALAPAVCGALGTYTGWAHILQRAPSWPETERLTTVDLGLWEAGASRFVGMGLSVCLLAALAVSSRRGLSFARETVAIAIGVVALSVAAALGGAPSAPWLGLVVLHLLVAWPRDDAPDEEPGVAATRVLVMGAAGVLALVVALARVEGRAAILWSATPTRAARIAEIVATAGERETTLVVGALLVAALAVAVVVRLRRAAAGGRMLAPRRSTVVLGALVAAGLATDLWLHARVAATRASLREALSEQFVVLGKLDPPVASALPASRFPPHRAPAVQVTSTLVAIDARPAAPLRALESEAGTVGLVRDVGQAIARGAVDQRSGSPDLSLAIDRRVPWRALSRVLAVAHAAGARDVEILLTAGAAPRIPTRAPPEAAHVLPGDFVALPATLVTGTTPTTPPDPETPFAAVAREWARRVRGGGRLTISGL